MFFMYSEWGDLHSLSHILLRNDADVLLYIDHERAENIGQGLVARTDNPNPPLGSIVIFDDTGMGDAGTDLRGRGFAVIGGNPYDRELGKKRRSGMEIMKAHKIATPEDHEFPDIPTAVKWLGTHGGEWFVKVDGDLGDESTVNGDAEYIIRYLEWLAESNKKVRGVEVQKKVDGEEISVEGWFDGQRFVFPFNATIEEKKFMPGDKGPRTGCESCVVFPYDGPLVEELLKMEDTLREEGYVGSLDLNMIVTDDGPKGLEWTARLGFDASDALFHLLEPTLPEQLEAFAFGALPSWDFKPEMALTLRLSIPPYPSDTAKEAGKRLDYPLDPAIMDIDIVDVKWADGSGPVCAGRDGLLGAITVLGTDIDSLRSGALKQANGLKIPNLQHRIDPVTRWEKTIKGLRAKGAL